MYEQICASAASHDHLEVLKWVRENSCPWDESVCYQAAKFGRLNIFHWLRSNGLPMESANIALLYCKPKILDWMKDNGFFNINDGGGQVEGGSNADHAGNEGSASIRCE